MVRLVRIVSVIALVFSFPAWGNADQKEPVENSPSATQEGFDLSHFPESKYTPFGYLANPYHTSIANRSGLIRSVPPLGFGYWARPLPWPYASGDFGFGLERYRNYLSFMHLSICSGGNVLHKSEDFDSNHVDLCSKYHTQNMMSYDFQFDGLTYCAMYFQIGENTLACRLTVKNTSAVPKKATVHATNTYGDIHKRYWGCDGIMSRYNSDAQLSVSKIYAEGDIFVLGTNREPTCYKATQEDDQWDQWIADNSLENAADAITSIRFKGRGGIGGGHIRSVLSYEIEIAPHATEAVTLCLTRGITERKAVAEYRNALEHAEVALQEKLSDDRKFYAGAPVLTGDWPRSWKNGMVYHFETIRMNIHPPIGIYQHHWDGMQIATPRSVLGEAAIDSMCLSYADIDLAKDVILGTFADAIAPNIPCSREDGSTNLICANGDECGTSPIWGLPFHVIHSIYLRDRDDQWMRELYPPMKSYLNWWLENRTDQDGWLHASCSWESGQDGSKRFLVEGHDAAAAAKFVRTVDIEAAMAHAMDTMALFAEVAGVPQDVARWRQLADERIARTRSMFVKGRYRDFDGRNNQPIILENYHSVMMLVPVSLGIATNQQLTEAKKTVAYFRDNYRFWLDWPSFLFPFSEAAWNTGERELIAQVLVNSGNGIFPGMDSSEVLPVRSRDCPGLPEEYSYRTPGVAGEWWPYLRKKEGQPDQWSRGCENYGWGATFPTLLIRNMIGFREVNNLKQSQFHLAPALPSTMFETGKTYGITNLSFRENRVSVDYTIMSDDIVRVHMKCKSSRHVILRITDEHGEVKAESDQYGKVNELSFDGENGGLYTVTVVPKVG